MQSRKYTDRDGIERTAVEVVAQDLVLLSGGGQGNGEGVPPRQRPGGEGGGIDPHDPPF